MIKLISIASLIILFGTSYSQSQCPTGYTISSTNETTYNACDGTITFTLTGGTPDFIYTIIDTANIINTFVDTSSNFTYTFYGLCPGTYECMVNNILGLFCPSGGGGSGATYATIQPAAASLSVSCNVIGVNCIFDIGDVEVIANGDAPPFQYSIDGGMSWQSGNYFSNAVTGGMMVDVAVTDATGQIVNSSCSAWIYIAPTPIITPTSSSCSNGCSGTANVYINGDDYGVGVQPYNVTIEQSTTGQTIAAHIFNQPGDTLFLSGLCAGTYTVYSYESSQYSCPGYIGSFNVLEDTNANIIASAWITDPANIGVCNGIALGEVSDTTGGPFNYEWLDCNGGNSYGTENTVNTLCLGDYMFVATNALGCSDTSECITMVEYYDDIQSFNEQQLIKIEPNPMKYSATIFFNNQDQAKYTCKVYDVNGKCVRIIANVRQSSVVIERDGLECGIYLVKLYSNEKFFTGKLNVVN